MPFEPWILGAIPIALWAFVFLPNRFCNRHATWIRWFITSVLGLQCLLASVGWVQMAVWGRHPLYDDHPIWLYDEISALMTALVSFIGWNIARFSLRYLDRTPDQGKYFRWVGFTLGSVLTMIQAGNLGLFLVAWILASLGLHQLLLFYPDRPAAQRAAWTKFIISRIGDIAILGAIIVCYSQAGTLHFATLFDSVASPSQWDRSSLAWASILFAVGAITKSAQFPFHTWLPLTMETPTPVSALMHAGVVNAGGYLMIRMNPIMSLSEGASLLLVSMGGLTALLGASIMLTQTSIKKKLAYSTMAQMGFMLLQCGLGAYTAAMLHIMAHSLYKAHAFLSSGSVLAQKSSMASNFSRPMSPSFFPFAFSVLILTLYTAGLMTWMGHPVTEEPGGALLGLLFCTGLACWWTMTYSCVDRTLAILAAIVASLLPPVYVVMFAGLEHYLSPNLHPVPWHDATLPVCVILVIGFFGLALLQLRWIPMANAPWFRSLYVHLHNGLYCENILRRWIGSLDRC